MSQAEGQIFVFKNGSKLEPFDCRDTNKSKKQSQNLLDLVFVTGETIGALKSKFNLYLMCVYLSN